MQTPEREAQLVDSHSLSGIWTNIILAGIAEYTFFVAYCGNVNIAFLSGVVIVELCLSVKRKNIKVREMEMKKNWVA